ncbi:rod shape-determining protein MreC [Longimonas halophila]|uniref:Cell shape-determining protein MreC n=1 Tax=Longimonas halophila TaxID=1469170 RepID=A0A2H3NHX1_9BACT|nr:rod shape-determining protein MreC [Longimonas halophila]PEN04959.1 rod shape-determining protein MreC [Longimonas halophila]
MDASQWESIRDWAVFLGLLLVACVVLVTVNRPFNQALRTYGMEVTARIEQQFAWVGRYTRALQENETLRARNIELSSEVARSRDARARNQALEAMLELKTRADSVVTDTTLAAARILQKDLTHQQNVLTLDVGRRDGIEPGMPVVTPDGIVGTVLLVSPRFCRVLPFLNTDFRVPGRIESVGAEGVVRWEGDALNRLAMEHVVKTEPVEVGQRVSTSGHSGVFPSGWPIGTIETVEPRPGRNDLAITLRPAVALHALDHAFVIRVRPSSYDLPADSTLGYDYVRLAPADS